MKEKLGGKNGIWVHNDHIDINIEINKIPFDLKVGERLYCQVKLDKKMGFKADDVVEMFVRKHNGEIGQIIDDDKILVEFKQKCEHQTEQLRMLGEAYKKLLNKNKTFKKNESPPD